MSQPDTHDHSSRIMTLDEYRKAHEHDRATIGTAPVRAAAPVDPDEQAGFRSFSPDYYAGIQAGMNRMRGTIGEAGPAAVSHAAAAQGGAAMPATQPQMIGAVPTDELLDHNYDGIQEYDNPTPGWWHTLFIGTVIFGGFYLLVYHLAVPPLSVRHATAEARHLDEQFAELNQLETGVPKILTIMNEEAWLSRGETIFTASCAICHSADGSGLVGPNLTDETYKNITTIMDITTMVYNGSATGSMPAQKNLLNENEIALVSAYVASLRGKNLPTNPSVDPSYTGVPIDPWPTLDAAGNVVPTAASATEQLSRSNG